MTDAQKTEQSRKRFSVHYVEGCQAESCLGDDKMVAWLNRNISPHERLVSAHPKTMTDGREFSVTWTLIVEDMLATQIVV